MEKLIIDGVWKSRPNEKTPVEFSYMSDASKHAYIFELLTIPEDELSTFEKLILNKYQKEQEFFNKDIRNIINDIELPSTNKEFVIDANIEDETELIKNIPNLSKQEIKELIDAYYAGNYPNWEIDLRQSKINNFIKNTEDFYGYTSFIIGLLTTYKSM